ncbi:MAG TPA: hypothetical protein DCE44_01835, partial [Verrucomicrobiales bacterium]|nr:hypothetical protein [Verrucomicrobiales bacterium]
MVALVVGVLLGLALAPRSRRVEPAVPRVTATPAIRELPQIPVRPSPSEVLIRPDQLAPLFAAVRSEPDPEVRRDRLRLLAARIAPSDAAASLLVARESLPDE